VAWAVEDEPEKKSRMIELLSTAIINNLFTNSIGFGFENIPAVENNSFDSLEACVFNTPCITFLKGEDLIFLFPSLSTFKYIL